MTHRTDDTNTANNSCVIPASARLWEPPKGGTTNGELPQGRPTSVRRFALYGLRLIVGIAIVAYLLYRFDFAEVWAVIRSAQLVYVLLAWVWTLIAMIALAILWNMSLRPLRTKFHWHLMLKLQFQQRFHALFLPGGAAAFIRWFRIIRPSGQPGLAVALMVFSRMTVLLATLTVTGAAILLDRQFPWPGSRWVAPVVVILYALLLYIATHQGLHARAFAIWANFPRPLRMPFLRNRLEAYAQAVATFTTAEILLILGLAFLAQASFVAEQICIARAVGMDVSIFTFGWVRTVILICMVLPITVSGLGLREASLTAVLALYGVPEELALAQSLVFFAAVVLMKGLIGGLLEFTDIVAERPARAPASKRRGRH